MIVQVWETKEIRVEMRLTGGPRGFDLPSVTLGKPKVKAGILVVSTLPGEPPPGLDFKYLWHCARNLGM